MYTTVNASTIAHARGASDLPGSGPGEPMTRSLRWGLRNWFKDNPGFAAAPHGTHEQTRFDEATGQTVKVTSHNFEEFVKTIPVCGTFAGHIHLAGLAHLLAYNIVVLIHIKDDPERPKAIRFRCSGDPAGTLWLRCFKAHYTALIPSHKVKTASEAILRDTLLCDMEEIGKQQLQIGPYQRPTGAYGPRTGTLLERRAADDTGGPEQASAKVRRTDEPDEAVMEVDALGAQVSASAAGDHPPPPSQTMGPPQQAGPVVQPEAATAAPTVAALPHAPTSEGSAPSSNPLRPSANQAIEKLTSTKLSAAAPL